MGLVRSGLQRFELEVWVLKMLEPEPAKRFRFTHLFKPEPQILGLNSDSNQVQKVCEPDHSQSIYYTHGEEIEQEEGCSTTTTASGTSSRYGEQGQTLNHSCSTSLEAEHSSIQSTDDRNQKCRNGWQVTGRCMNTRRVGGKAFGGMGVYWEVRAVRMQFRRGGRCGEGWARCMSQDSRMNCATRRNDMRPKLQLWGGRQMLMSTRRYAHIFQQNQQMRGQWPLVRHMCTCLMFNHHESSHDVWPNPWASITQHHTWYLWTQTCHLHMYKIFLQIEHYLYGTLSHFNVHHQYSFQMPIPYKMCHLKLSQTSWLTLTLPSHLLSLLWPGDCDESIAMLGGGTCVRGLQRMEAVGLVWLCLVSFELDLFLFLSSNWYAFFAH